MPLYNRFFEDQNIVLLTAYGSLTGADLRHCVQEYVGHPGFNAKTDVLIDLEDDVEVRSGFVSGLSEVDRIVQAVREDEVRYYIAVVASTPAHEKIIETMRERLQSDFTLKKFGDLTVALHWLKLKRRKV